MGIYAHQERAGSTFLLPIDNMENVGDEIGRVESSGFECIDTIHFLSLAVLPAGDAVGTQLLIEVNFDGQRRDLLHALWSHQSFRGLIESACGKSLNLSEFVSLLESVDEGRGTLFRAFSNLTCRKIRRVIRIHRKAREELASLQHARTMSSKELWSALSDELKCHAGRITFQADRRIMRARLAPWIYRFALFVLGALLVQALGIRSLAAPDCEGMDCMVPLAALAVSWVMGLLIVFAVVLFLTAKGSRRLVTIPLLLLAVLMILRSDRAGLVSIAVWSYLLIFTSIAALALLHWFSRVNKTDPLYQFYGAGITGVTSLFLFLLLMVGASVVFLGNETPAYMRAFIIMLSSLVLLPILFRCFLSWSISSGATLLGLGFGFLVEPSAPDGLFYAAQSGFAVCSVLLLWLIGRVVSRQEEQYHARELQPIWTSENRDQILLDETENLHNHLLSITKVREGSSILLNLVLWNTRFQLWMGEPARLSGISTIHFARWVRIDGDRLLFLSNYDGIWEPYLDEFVNEASRGLSAIWSNCVGFPITRWYSQDGAESAHRFKIYARNSLVPTSFHYRGYDATVPDLEKAVEVVKILQSRRPTNEQCERLVQLL